MQESEKSSGRAVDVDLPVKRKRQQLIPKRPFVVEVIGLPESWKSTLIRELVVLFGKELNSPAIGFSQDDDSKTDFLIRKLRRDLEIVSFRKSCIAGMKPKFQEVVSVVFRAILKLYSLKAELMSHDVILFEQGPYFTWIVESIWARVPKKILEVDFRGVIDPDFVIFLSATPEEIRRSHTRSPMLLDHESARRIYEEMERTARRKGWARIERTNIKEMAGVAFGEIICKLRGHVEHPKPFERFVY